MSRINHFNNSSSMKIEVNCQDGETREYEVEFEYEGFTVPAIICNKMDICEPADGELNIKVTHVDPEVELQCDMDEIVRIAENTAWKMFQEGRLK